MVGVAFLGLLTRLHSDRRLYRFEKKGGWKLLNALQEEGVVELEGEDELLNLHLAIAPGEYS